MKLFKKAFWVPYPDSDQYPTVSKAMEAITAYCAECGQTCRFIGEDRVEIDGVPYEVYRGYESGSRGNYGIKCRQI